MASNSSALTEQPTSGSPEFGTPSTAAANRGATAVLAGPADSAGGNPYAVPSPFTVQLQWCGCFPGDDCECLSWGAGLTPDGQVRTGLEPKGTATHRLAAADASPWPDVAEVER